MINAILVQHPFAQRKAVPLSEAQFNVTLSESFGDWKKQGAWERAIDAALARAVEEHIA